MSKRFRDTEIWTKPWYRKMPPVLKCAWSYILDNCDSVGVWVPDFEAAEFFIGEGVDWNGLRDAANGNIETLANGKWFVVDFVSFQYGELRESCQPHRSYLALLERHGLKGYGKGSRTLKEKDKEKEPEKDKEKETFAEGVRMTKAEYSALCAKYTKPTIDLAIQKVAAQQIKTGKHYASPRGAILQWGIRAALEEMKKGGGPQKTLEEKRQDYCPECHIGGGNHGAFCSRKPA